MKITKHFLIILIAFVFGLSVAQNQANCPAKDYELEDGADFAIHFFAKGHCYSVPVFTEGLPAGKTGTYYYDPDKHQLYLLKDNARYGDGLGNLIALGDVMVTTLYNQQSMGLAWALQALQCKADGPSLVLAYFGWPSKEKVSLEELKESCPDMSIIPRSPR